MLLLFCSSFAKADINDGFIHGYGFDNSYSDIIGSSSGTACGTISFTNGFIGQAISCNKGYVRLEDSQNTLFGIESGDNGKITILCWYNPSTSNNKSKSRPLVTNSDWTSGKNAGVCIDAQHGSGSKTGPQFNIGDGTNRMDIYGNQYSANTWQFVAITADLSTNTANLYYGTSASDGTLQQLGSATPSSITSLLSNYKWYIGEDYYQSCNPDATNDYCFYGLIDEVGIWNRALSEAEINQIYTAQKAGTSLASQLTLATSASTVQAGAFTNATTWTGGVIPKVDANVEINSAVTTNGRTFNGEVVIGENGSLTANGCVFVGHNSNGSLIINGGENVFTANNTDVYTDQSALSIGYQGGAGQFILNNGSVTVNGLAYVGYETAGETKFIQNNGTFNSTDILIGPATGENSTAQIIVTGGTFNATSIKYADSTNPPASSSLFEVSDNGIANIGEELSVSTNVKGGTLNVGSIAIPESGKLDVSDGTINLGEGGITAEGAYTINLSGGTFATKEASWETSLNATVAANSKITFAPESGQTITWEGALTGNGDILKTGEGRLKINYDNDNSEVIKFDVDNFVVASGPVDIKGYMYCNLSVEGPDAVFSPGNSVGDAVFGGGFILKEGATLLIEQDASGIDTLTATSFDIDSNSIIDIAADSLQPGESYDIIFQTDSEGNPIIFTEAQATDDYWNNLLTPESAYYWNLSVSGNIVRASVDSNAVPEPSTWALLILGAAGLLYVRKRNRK